MTDSAVEEVDHVHVQSPTADQQERDAASWAATAFIASYSSESTRRTYTTQLRL